MISDLFGNEAPVAGLRVKDDAISAADETELIREIDQLNLPNFQFQQWSSNRRTRSFGWLYDFRDSSFGATEPIPSFLLPFKDLAAEFAGVSAPDVVQASVIKYDAGAGIGWHIDRPEFDAVIGISLGSDTTMRFRRRTKNGFDRASVILPRCSMYLLDGEVRYEWEHSIAPMTKPRWSITFRGLSEKSKQKFLASQGAA